MCGRPLWKSKVFIAAGRRGDIDLKNNKSEARSYHRARS